MISYDEAPKIVIEKTPYSDVVEASYEKTDSWVFMIINEDVFDPDKVVFDGGGEVSVYKETGEIDYSLELQFLLAFYPNEYKALIKTRKDIQVRGQTGEPFVLKKKHRNTLREK